jgi:hypothetical protein
MAQPGLKFRPGTEVTCYLRGLWRVLGRRPDGRYILSALDDQAQAKAEWWEGIVARRPGWQPCAPGTVTAAARTMRAATTGTGGRA